VIETGPALKNLFDGSLSASDALQTGLVRVEGDATLLETFAHLFHIETHRETANI
jgi:hypothetical protein